MENKPHLVLDWIFNIPTQKLTCKVDDELSYEAIEGGTKGYYKSYKGKTVLIDSEAWNEEKSWISENYGEQVGYFQPDYNRYGTHHIHGTPDFCPMGIGPDGRYLDHLQRRQAILDGNDCARIYRSDYGMLFETPDCGKTIYKRIPTTDTNYAEFAKKYHPEQIIPATYPEHPQPCMMQPRSPGRTLSSYDDMLENGVSEDVVNKCKTIEWESPMHPELQYMIEMA
jgi:hypothetical protein